MKIISFVFFFYTTVLAQQGPQTMTKMEVLLRSPDVPVESFAAKPKIVYRAGYKYCRIEEAADPDHGLHNVMIIDEPDYWTVNLVSKTAQHGMDPGPTFNCHLPIFAYSSPQSLDKEKEKIRGLEFGQELEFFQSKGAVAEPGPVLFKHETTMYKVQVGTSTLTLFLAKSQELPIAVSLEREDKSDIFVYSQYARIEFDPKLFAKPADVKIEAVQSK